MLRHGYSFAEALRTAHRCILHVTGSTQPISPDAPLYFFNLKTPEQLQQLKLLLLTNSQISLAPSRLRGLSSRWTLQRLASALLESKPISSSESVSLSSSAVKTITGKKRQRPPVRGTEKTGTKKLRSKAGPVHRKPATKSQIVNRLAATLGIKRNSVEAIFKELASLAQENVRRHGEFTLPGFGKLVLSERKAREGRNPLSGETIRIPAKHTLKFHVGKGMKDKVAPKFGKVGRRASARPAAPPYIGPDLRIALIDKKDLRLAWSRRHTFKELPRKHAFQRLKMDDQTIKMVLATLKDHKPKVGGARAVGTGRKRGGKVASKRGLKRKETTSERASKHLKGDRGHDRSFSDRGADIRPGSSRGRDDVEKVKFNFHAEMNEQVVIDQFTNVEIIISREEIERARGAASKSGQRTASPREKMEVEVAPISNFESVGDFRIPIDPPPEGEPQHLNFGLKATHLGEGEVMVLVYQRQSILVNLILRPRVVKTLSKSSSRRAVNSRPAPEADSLNRPLHELYIRELNPMPGMIRYLFYMNSPALSIKQDWETEIQIDTRRQYVENIYRNIEDQWGDSESDVDRFAAALRAYGGQLFDELIPKELQSILWKHRNDIKSIHITSNEPFIPWEIVHLKSPSRKKPGQTQMPRETKFLGQMGAVRWLLPSGGSPPQRLRIGKGRARYVLPKYIAESLKLPQAESEIDFVKEKFSATPVPPVENSIRRLISKPGAFDLLHLACHGYARMDNLSNAQLILQRNFVRGRYVTENLRWEVAQQYANLATDENRPMIVLNACQTGRVGHVQEPGTKKVKRKILSERADYRMTGLGGFARAFIENGAGAFIGTLWNIGDNPARVFIETLYTQLLRGSNLAQASVKAREKARAAGDATWLAYVVYGHPHMKIVS